MIQLHPRFSRTSAASIVTCLVPLVPVIAFACLAPACSGSGGGTTGDEDASADTGAVVSDAATDRTVVDGSTTTDARADGAQDSATVDAATDAGRDGTTGDGGASDGATTNDGGATDGATTSDGSDGAANADASSSDGGTTCAIPNGGAGTPGPSCVGLAATCGACSENCCNSFSVPATTFSREGDPQDVQTVATVSAFRLDEFAITVGRYRKFIESKPQNERAALIANLKTPTCTISDSAVQPSWTDAVGANENLPQNCINRADVTAFCAYDQGTIPTFAQLQAARLGGTEHRVYAWSDPATSQTIDISFAAYDVNNVHTGLSNVGSKLKGRGRYGQLDLSGNVWQITKDDDVDLPFPCVDCVGTGNPTRFLRVGGSVLENAGTLESKEYDSNPEDRRTENGGRCARAN